MRVVGYYADVTDRVNEHLRSAANTEALERLREEGKTLREIREETGATAPSVYHALKVRPKNCFSGMKSRTLMPRIIKRWR